MRADLEEDAVVEERRQPLARGHLAAGVLLLDRSAPPICANLRAARLEIGDQLSHVQACFSVTLAPGPLPGLALLQEGREALARVVGREAPGEALAQERQRALEVEIVLRGERA